MASVIRKITEYNAGITPELKELKWKALKESPFRFYRGTCHLFAQDVARIFKSRSKLKVWTCGDLHFENFGSYKGENRVVYFDVNDFDEAILAPPETEVIRFMASIIIASQQMKAGTMSVHKCLHDALQAYTDTLRTGKVLMLEPQVAHGEFKKYFEHLETFDRQEFIAKRTYKHKGALLLKPDNEHFIAIDDKTKEKVFKAVSPLLGKGKFEHLVYEDAAYRIAGTGSLGLTRYCVLCYSKKKGQHYLIDIKETRRSCHRGYVKVKQPRFKNDAERVNMAGFLMQFNSPAFMATLKMDGLWYQVKELQLVADKMDLTELADDFSSFSAVATEMAVLMAYAHLRASGHLGASSADELMAFAEKKHWHEAVLDASVAIAKRNSRYYKDFVAKA
jgi:uncharacterized protein (DUF2252 family)